MAGSLQRSGDDEHTVQDRIVRLACLDDGAPHAVHTGELGLAHLLCHHSLQG